MSIKSIKKVSCKLLFSCLFLFVATSCTEKMEGLNKDTKLISDEDLQADANAGGFLLPAMMNNIVSTTTSYQTQQNLEADSYSGYLESPTPFLDNKNTMTYFMVGGWINNTWNVPTHGVMDNWLLMDKQGYETKYPDLYAIALIIRVFAGERLVDTFGPYPYTDYGSSASTTFNTVEEAYNAFFSDLDKAIAALQKAEAADPDADQVRFKKWDKSSFEGEYTSWIKLANTLKLRCAMHLSLVKPDLAKKEAEEAVDPANGGVLTTAEGSFNVQPSATNVYYTMTNAWSDCRMSAAIISYMEGFNDPRLPIYALPATDPVLNGKIEGIRAGIDKPSKAVYQFYSKPNFQPNSTMKQLDVAESYFLRAEGALRGWNMGGTAKDFYEEGVKASFEENGVSGADAYLQGTTTMAAYTDPKNPKNNSDALTDEVVKWDDNATFEEKLEKIITQKWIAMFPEGTEAWVEFRRTGYPKLYPIMVSNNPDLPVGTFIKRLTYPPTVTNASQAAVDAAIAKDLNGHASAAEPLWWDVN